MANTVYICIISIVIVFGIIKEIKKMKNESIRKRNEAKGIRDFTQADKSLYQQLKEIKRTSKMNFIKKILAPKEVKAALGILDEASYTFDNEAFQLVRNRIEKMILAQTDEFVNIIQKGMSPRQWVYSAIANISGDLVESGKYHIYRGVLNDMGPGNDLLKLFNAAVDELVKIGIVDNKYAKTQKEAILKNINSVG